MNLYDTGSRVQEIQKHGFNIKRIGTDQYTLLRYKKSVMLEWHGAIFPYWDLKTIIRYAELIIESEK